MYICIQKPKTFSHASSLDNQHHRHLTKHILHFIVW